MVSINFFWKFEHFNIQFVFVAVQNKKVTNFLLMAVHNEAHQQSVCGRNVGSRSCLLKIYRSSSDFNGTGFASFFCQNLGGPIAPLPPWFRRPSLLLNSPKRQFINQANLPLRPAAATCLRAFGLISQELLTCAQAYFRTTVCRKASARRKYRPFTSFTSNQKTVL